MIRGPHAELDGPEGREALDSDSWARNGGRLHSWRRPAYRALHRLAELDSLTDKELEIRLDQAQRVRGAGA